eukprot:2035144-Rhodomonas_salina.8
MANARTVRFAGQHAVTGGWGTLSIINMDRLTPKGGQMSEGNFPCYTHPSNVHTNSRSACTFTQKKCDFQCPVLRCERSKTDASSFASRLQRSCCGTLLLPRGFQHARYDFRC